MKRKELDNYNGEDYQAYYNSVYFKFKKGLWMHSWLLAYKPVECKLDDIEENEINTWFTILKQIT